MAEVDNQPVKKSGTAEEKEVVDLDEVAGMPEPMDEEPMDKDPLVDSDRVQEPAVSSPDPTSTEEQNSTTEPAERPE